MNWTINQTVDLSRGYTPVVWPDALMVSGDVGAHTWRVAVLDNGVPADLSGATIAGSFLRADGNTVLVSGSVSGNIAIVTLTDVCYAVEGKMKGTIKMTKSGAVITLAAVIFTVSLFTSGSVIDPGVAYADFQIDASPRDVYADLAALTAANPDHSKIYITLDDGKWRYWNGSAWVAGGTYMSGSTIATNVGINDSSHNYGTTTVEGALEEIGAQGFYVENGVTNKGFADTAGLTVFRATMTVSGGEAHLNADGGSFKDCTLQMDTELACIAGHKYYFKYDMRSSKPNIVRHQGNYFSSANGAYVQITNAGYPPPNEWWTFSDSVLNVSHTGGTLKLAFVAEWATGADAAGAILDIRRVMAIDLTAAFGAGNEPSANEVGYWLGTVGGAELYFDYRKPWGSRQDLYQRLGDVGKKIKHVYPRICDFGDAVAAWRRGEKFPIAFFGDSTTAGSSTTGYNGAAYAAGLDNSSPNAYCTLLQAKLRARYGSSALRIYNAGMAGWSTVNALANFDAIFKTGAYADAKMVGVMYGINDRSLGVDTFKANLEEIVQRLYALGMQPFLITPQAIYHNNTVDDDWLTTPNSLNYLTNSIAKATKEVAAKYNLVLIDNNEATRNYMANADVPMTDIIADALHFFDGGHAFEAGNFFAHLTGDAIVVCDEDWVGAYDPRAYTKQYTNSFISEPGTNQRYFSPATFAYTGELHMISADVLNVSTGRLLLTLEANNTTGFYFKINGVVRQPSETIKLEIGHHEVSVYAAEGNQNRYYGFRLERATP